MGDHHLGKHDVRVVVISGDLPIASVVAMVVSIVSAVVVAVLVAQVVASVLPDPVALPQAASARAEPFRVIWGQWREVVDQWTAVDAGVGVVCSSFGLVGARRAGSKSIRRSS